MSQEREVQRTEETIAREITQRKSVVERRKQAFKKKIKALRTDQTLHGEVELMSMESITCDSV